MLKINFYFAFIIFIMANTSFGFNIKKKQELTIDKEKHFTINVEYPYFENKNVNQLNALIKNQVNADIEDFKNTLTQNAKDFLTTNDMPKLNKDSNTLTITYKIFTNSPSLISLRFAKDIYYYGSAHPNTAFNSINYDLKNNTQLKLDALFKGDYLHVFSSYSKKVLTETLSTAASVPTEPDENGIAPKAENFQVWNLTPNGIYITFPAYQVAAYVFGPQEVFIPKEILKPVLNQYQK